MRALQARLWAGLQGLRGSEQGIALPVALLITVIALGFAAVPIMASVSSQNGDSRDQAANQALAAAESGAELAIAELQAGSSCAPEAWCTGAGGEIDGSEYEYEYRQGVSAECGAAATASEVVATGIVRVGGRPVHRRVSVSGCAEATGDAPPEFGPPPNVFAGGQLVGIDSLILGNNAQVRNGGAGSNGTVTMSGGANVCGVVQYGVSFKTDNSGSERPPSGCSVGRTVTQGTIDYPPVALPEDITENNSNWRLAGADPVPSDVWQRGNVSWSPSNRSLTVNYSSLTLSGSSPYFLCQLTLAGGSTLQMAPGAKIKVFFDAPSKCPGLNGASQLIIANGAHVKPDSANGPGFYFVGSEGSASQSKITLAGGASGDQLVIYAPFSQVTYDNGTSFRGVIIARTLKMEGGAVNEGAPFEPPDLEDFLPPEEKPGSPQNGSLSGGRFVECTAHPTEEGKPESGC